jgi:hypothetical protein
MRVVGKKNRSEIETNPALALKRGKLLDEFLRAAAVPVERGVSRGTHAHFNRLEAQRQARIARKLNAT